MRGASLGALRALLPVGLSREGCRMNEVRRKKRILVVCGTSIATSTIVATKIEEIMKSHGIVAEIRRARTTEAQQASKDVDLVVSTTPLHGLDVPVLSGIPYLTGVGSEELTRQIIEMLTDT